MKRPTLALAVAVDRSVREHDEWFDEPDDLDRVERAIAAIATMSDPVEAAAVLASRLDVEDEAVALLRRRRPAR